MLRKHRPKLRLTREMLSLPKQVKTISILVFVYSLGWAMVEPFLYIYLKEIFGSYTSVGIIVSLLFLFSIIFSLLIGPIVNRVSQKIMIIFTLALYLPLSYFLLNLKTFFEFALLRVYNSFTASSLWSSMEGYLRENADRKKIFEAFGLFDTMISLAYVAGPILGALLLVKYGFSMFYVISICSFLSIFVALTLKERKKEGFIQGMEDVVRKDRIVWKEIRDFLRDKKLVRIEILEFVYVFATAGIGMVLPLFLKEQNASYLEIGIIASLYYLPWISESYFSILKNRYVIMRNALLVGTALLIFIFLTNSMYSLFLLVFLLFTALTAVGTFLRGMITKCMPRKEIGELSGVDLSIKNLAAGTGLIVAGIISDGLGLKYVFLMTAILLTALFLMTSMKKFKF